MPIKIYLANESNQGLGGGWTFLSNLKSKGGAYFDFVSYDEADVFFISGATMVTREFVEQAKKDGKKIVLRIDNIPKNSRNRNTGTSRLYDFAQLADLIVYQSRWAKEYLSPFVKKDGPIIINGANEDIFNKDGGKLDREGDPIYLYTRFNRDETKQWHQAWYDYQMIQRQNKNAMLWIVGQFSAENIEYNFDFFMGERFRYLGVIEEPEEMAMIYRSVDVLLAPYYYDACSNTIIEAKLCGCDLMVNETGGNTDILKAKPEDLTASKMCLNYYNEIKKLI